LPNRFYSDIVKNSRQARDSSVRMDTLRDKAPRALVDNWHP